MAASPPNACLICGDFGSSPVTTELSYSQNSAAKFLLDFNVIISADENVTYQNESLCASCFDVVVSCDQWSYLLSNGVEQLRNKFAEFSSTSPGNFLMLKIDPEMNEYEVC